MLLIGFDRLSPAQQMLINSARATGSRVAVLDPPNAPNIPELVQAEELREELGICAWWARRILERDPAASIAIVVQGIDDKRGEIERTFRGILMPESVGIEADDAMPFEFSLGTPLATVPVVKAALLLLRWLGRPLDQAAISWLMISGFLAASNEDLVEMAALDAEIRERGQMPPETQFESFTRYHPRLDSDTARKFLNRLRGLQRTARGRGSRRIARRPSLNGSTPPRCCYSRHNGPAHGRSRVSSIKRGKGGSG